MWFKFINVQLKSAKIKKKLAALQTASSFNMVRTIPILEGPVPELILGSKNISYNLLFSDFIGHIFLFRYCSYVISQACFFDY